MPDELFTSEELKFIQEYLTNSENALLISNDTTIQNSLNSKKLQIFSSNAQTIHDKIDGLLLSDTIELGFSKYTQKFDTIVILDLLEKLKHPDLFLNYVFSILTDGGIIICSFSNFYHVNNIFDFISGNLINSNFFTMSKFYDLDKFLFFLNQNNAHISNLKRIKQNFSPSITLDQEFYFSNLLNLVKTIPDYDTKKYVLTINKGKLIDSQNLEFVTQFPKNYIFNSLQKFFEKYFTLEQSIVDKDMVISGHENSIKEQKEYIKNLEQYIRNVNSAKKSRFWKR